MQSKLEKLITALHNLRDALELYPRDTFNIEIPNANLEYIKHVLMSESNPAIYAEEIFKNNYIHLRGCKIYGIEWPEDFKLDLSVEKLLGNRHYTRMRLYNKNKHTTTELTVDNEILDYSDEVRAQITSLLTNDDRKLYNELMQKMYGDKNG